MAGFMSEYLADSLLDHIFGNTPYVAPGTLYCALFTVAPDASGGGTEVSGGSYARVAVTNNVTNFAAASGQIKRNATAITFPAPTADWGEIVGAAWFDDDGTPSGNMLMYGAFTTPREVLEDDAAPSIIANGGTFTLE